jgi:hypothetical protein
MSDLLKSQALRAGAGEKVVERPLFPGEKVAAFKGKYGATPPGLLHFLLTSADLR